MSTQIFKQCRIENIRFNDRPPGRPPVEQSKGPPKSVRFTPDDEEAIMRAANSDRQTFQSYMERCAKVGVHFSAPEIDILLSHSNVPLFKSILSRPEILRALHHLISAETL
jgi:hypothetical protein